MTSEVFFKFTIGLIGFVLALGLAIGLKWLQRVKFKDQLRPVWLFEILADLASIGLCFLFAWTYYHYYWVKS